MSRSMRAARDKPRGLRARSGITKMLMRIEVEREQPSGRASGRAISWFSTTVDVELARQQQGGAGREQDQVMCCRSPRSAHQVGNCVSVRDARRCTMASPSRRTCTKVM